MVSRLSALVVWALVAGSGVFWGFRLWSRPASSSLRTVATADPASAQSDLSRLFGAALAADSAGVAAAPEPEISARFRLTGVMAPKHPSEQGLAVISIDGNPARVYRVGAWIDGDLMLREVSLRTATVASARNADEAQTAFVLEVPAINAPATGVLSPTLSITGPVPVTAPVRVPQGLLSR